MLFAAKQSGGRVYYYTRCRTCISMRKRKSIDPQYRCVWCDPSQVQGKVVTQAKVERRAMYMFIPLFLILVAAICLAITHR